MAMSRSSPWGMGVRKAAEVRLAVLAEGGVDIAIARFEDTKGAALDFGARERPRRWPATTSIPAIARVTRFALSTSAAP